MHERHIPEADWKVFKKLQPLAQKRYYQRAIEGCKRICNDDSKPALDRFGELHDYVREQSKETRPFLHDFRRSTVIMCVMYMVTRGLITDDELSQFSEEVQG